MIPVVGYMAAYNEAEYIEYAIRSTIGHVDVMIVIEGAFKETVDTGGSPHSDDGTLDILTGLKKEFGDKLLLVQGAAVQQLQHRNTIFNAVKLLRPEIAENPYWLWLIDADEVYDDENAAILMALLNTTSGECIKVDSKTFVNDFRHYVKIAFPRCFKIKPDWQHWFSAPNHISRHETAWGHTETLNDREVNHEDLVCFFHYSYAKDPDRFTQKKKEREKVHGHFKWYLDGDSKVTADGINLRKHDGEHPSVMQSHPRMKNES